MSERTASLRGRKPLLGLDRDKARAILQDAAYYGGRGCRLVYRLGKHGVILTALSLGWFLAMVVSIEGVTVAALPDAILEPIANRLISPDPDQPGVAMMMLIMLRLIGIAVATVGFWSWHRAAKGFENWENNRRIWSGKVIPPKPARPPREPGYFVRLGRELVTDGVKTTVSGIVFVVSGLLFLNFFVLLISPDFMVSDFVSGLFGIADPSIGVSRFLILLGFGVTGGCCGVTGEWVAGLWHKWFPPSNPS